MNRRADLYAPYDEWVRLAGMAIPDEVNWHNPALVEIVGAIARTLH
ncbi:protein of unknown function [Methylocella tundrae]|uniref:Uncharacterized protein n=1 Tax=Methylocella tundrae TaxID=227605 RepID=A0A4U8Z4I7_METTU|nr:protein of unknown function [Methylocella tundrae]